MFNKKYNFKNYLWTIPFLSFLLGYFTVQNIFQPKSFDTPAIVGKKLQEAIAILSKHQLNLKFILEKEDATLPHGTILSQKPVPGLKITPNQSVYVTISKKPDKSACPELYNKNINDISLVLKNKNLKSKNFYVPSNLPTNSCVAQYPLPEASVKDTCIIMYVSKGNSKPVIFPSFKNKRLPEVVAFLKNNNIKVEIIYSDSPGLSKRELKKLEASSQNEKQEVIVNSQDAQTNASPEILNPEAAQELVAQENRNSPAQDDQDLQTTQTQNLQSPTQAMQSNPEATEVIEYQEPVEDLTILDQRPLAGSLIILDHSRPITVHLKVYKQ